MRKALSFLRSAGLVFLLVHAAQYAVAQTATIKGLVKDGNGNPLGGASVTVQGQKVRTTSDANGNYSLKVSPGKIILVISYVGQSPKQYQLNVTAGETVTQNADLSEISDLSGVVVLGSRSREPLSKLSTP